MSNYKHGAIVGYGISLPRNLLSQMYNNLLIYMSTCNIYSKEFDDPIMYEDDIYDFTKSIINCFNENYTKIQNHYRTNSPNTNLMDLLEKITRLEIKKNVLHEQLITIVSGNAVSEQVKDNKNETILSFSLGDNNKKSDVFIYFTSLSSSTHSNDCSYSHLINPDIFAVRPVYYEAVNIFFKTTGLIELYKDIFKIEPSFQWGLFTFQKYHKPKKNNKLANIHEQSSDSSDADDETNDNKLSIYEQ